MPGPKTLAVDVLLLLLTVIHSTTSTQAQVSHSTSRNHLRRRHSKSSGISSGKTSSNNYIPTYNWEQKEYVKAHNDLREELGVPPLQWHPDLANFSHTWATQLRDTCDYRSHSHGNYGENIFWSLYKEFTPTYVVKKWHSEAMHFDHVTNLCKCQPETDKCECGHYLNVIWKTTQWVGCSNAVYCNEAKGVIVVCEYDPIGNYKGINPLDPPPLEKEVSGMPVHVPPPPPPPPINSGGAAAAAGHQPSINTAHVPPLTPGHASNLQPPINKAGSSAAQVSPPTPPINSGRAAGHASNLQPPINKAGSSAAQVSPLTPPINSGRAAGHTSHHPPINTGKVAGHSLIMPSPPPPLHTNTNSWAEWAAHHHKHHQVTTNKEEGN